MDVGGSFVCHMLPQTKMIEKDLRPGSSFARARSRNRAGLNTRKIVRIIGGLVWARINEHGASVPFPNLRVSIGEGKKMGAGKSSCPSFLS
jgi:hypothetical protein